MSAHVDSNWKFRLKFVQAVMQEPALARRLQNQGPTSPLGRLIDECPKTLGNLIWPYQCAAWDAKARFDRIDEHLNAVENLAVVKLFGDEKIVFADLRTLSKDLLVVIDHSPWLAREGHLTLSLFKGNFRAFTIAFSLHNYPQTELFIGGIQGRKNNDDILELYRELTRELHGVRPRDFMLEMLRLFAARLGVKHIHAVADDCKISRHPYFGNKETPGLRYDDVWEDRGGSRIAETHFELPLAGERRNLDDVMGKKRAMYRRRYQMFDEISAGLPDDLSHLKRVTFEAL
jgi:uncharacterized protein VirK/YbjX